MNQPGIIKNEIIATLDTYEYVVNGLATMNSTPSNGTPLMIRSTVNVSGPATAR
jgi:hypothetical protein